MLTCPSCQTGQWPDETRGRRICPQCGVTLALRRTSVKQLAQGPRYISGGEHLARKRLYTVVHPETGTILCACCAAMVPFSSTINGRIEADGFLKVNVQRSWTLRDGALHPAYEQRIMPRNIRGRICEVCASAYHATTIGKVAAPPRCKVRSMAWNTAIQREQAESGAADWAHTGDVAWMAATSYHMPGMCDCQRCTSAVIGKLEMARMVASVTGNVTLDVLRGPLAYYEPTPAVARRPLFTLFQAPHRAPQRIRIGGPLVSLGAPATPPRCKHGLPPGMCALCK